VTYTELIAACTRAVGAQPGVTESLADCLVCLMAHTPNNRAITAEVLARFMMEFIESQRQPVAKGVH
jgi:predicted DNA-binding protein (UPF0278 family)